MNYAIILSGGIGTRMKADCPKQYIPVGGKPIIMYTLETFEKCALIDRIVIVSAEKWVGQIREWCSGIIPKLYGFAPPGETRQMSILNGLKECCFEEQDQRDDVVIIHDAVRPMVSEKLIIECIEQAGAYGGCMPVLNVTDTTYFSKDGKHIDQLLDRDALYAGQAPEAFKLMPYLKMNTNASKEELKSFRGTSEIAYKYGKNYGIEVRLIPGESENRKITTQQDLEWFKLKCREI